MSTLTEVLTDFLSFQPLNKSLEFPNDFIAIPKILIGWATIYFTLNVFVLKPLSKRIFPAPENSKDQKYLKDRHKFEVAGWKFANFIISGIVGWYLVMTESWIFSPPDYFKGWPEHGMSDHMKLYYQMGLSSYLFALLQMPFEPKQKFTDILALVVHHASTLFLIWTSYIYGFHRVGIVVLFLHDLADPFMEFAKMNLYAGKTKAADVFFGLFAVVFLITRNFLFPFYVIMPIPKNARFPDGSPLPNPEWHFRLQAGLWVLAALHVYWAALILRMAYKALVDEGVSDDIRNVEQEQ